MPSVSSSRGKSKSIDFEKEISTALASIPLTKDAWAIPLGEKDLQKLEKGGSAVEPVAEKAIKKLVINALASSLKEFYKASSLIERELFEKPDFWLQFKSTIAYINLVPYPIDQPKFEADLFSGKHLHSMIEGMKKSPKKLNQFNYWFIPCG